MLSKISSAKLSKTFENLLLEILLLYMTIQRKINFTQMERYGTHCEQTFRTNFNRLTIVKRLISHH